MVCTSYKTVYAMLAALLVGSASAGQSVCYAPWHHPTVTKELLLKDILEIGIYFSSFRTFETRMNNLNVIQVAGEAGVKVAVGVQMNDLAAVDAEIEAVCTGFGTNPEALEAVYVGNENLQNNGFGTVSADQLIGYIKRVKECTHGAVPVGTVQRINEWLSAEGAMKVADASDLIGINVYPFFTLGDSSPVEKLQAQWEQMTGKYDAAKCRLTETGWPTKGEDSVGNHASLETTQLYFDAFLTWAQDKGPSYWFMMYDTTKSYTGMEYEMNFGLFTATGTMKVKIPGSMGSKTGIPMNGSEIIPDPAIVPGTNSSNNDHPENPVQETPVQGTPVQETPVQGTPGAPPATHSEPVYALIEPLYFDSNGKPVTGGAKQGPYEVNLPADATTGHPPVVESGNGEIPPVTEAGNGASTQGIPEENLPTDGTPVVQPGNNEVPLETSVGVPMYRDSNGKPVDGGVKQGIPEKDEPVTTLGMPPVVDSGKDCAM
uniref:glucan endo-1,3-beta-D-glucosidase n=1 Tax=Hyaloperonospora arabidopsidis (strain Emoy2) TaxID=559515 RepID=M4BG78_HYAAE